MNPDELRAKIIIDQVQADENYTWISKKLEVNFIDQKVLTNEYNNLIPSRETWELYYVYNKLVISFTNRVKSLYNVSKNEKKYHEELNNNIGMIFRLMFIKALYICNDMFFKHRQNRGLVPKMVANFFIDKKRLKNIWDYLNIDNPTGFWEYIKTKKTERIWRKF